MYIYIYTKSWADSLKPSVSTAMYKSHQDQKLECWGLEENKPWRWLPLFICYRVRKAAPPAPSWQKPNPVLSMGRGRKRRSRRRTWSETAVHVVFHLHTAASCAKNVLPAGGPLPIPIAVQEAQNLWSQVFQSGLSWLLLSNHSRIFPCPCSWPRKRNQVVYRDVLLLAQ